MARKPNYQFERMERERLKANKTAAKAADAVKTGTVTAQVPGKTAGLPDIDTIPIPIPRPKA